MLEDLGRIEKEILFSLSDVKTEKEISEIRVRVLGRRGSLTQLLKQLGNLPEAERREIGKGRTQVRRFGEAD
jgi:phenylalanyl-tRNA synthetase alpha chain